MEDTEIIPSAIFDLEDAKQFWVSAAVIRNSNNQVLVNDEWYERHLAIFFELSSRYPSETAEILEYLSQGAI